MTLMSPQLQMVKTAFIHFIKIELCYMQKGYLTFKSWLTSALKRVKYRIESLSG